MNRVSSVAFRVAVAAIILCFGVSRLQAQAPASPVPDAQDSRMSAPAVSAAAQTAKSNAPKQAPLLLELTKEVTTKSAKPGAEAHFRVVEDVIEDGLLVIAEGAKVVAKIEGVDKHAGPEKIPVLLARFGTVKTVTGEQLPIVSATGNQNGEPEKLTMQFNYLPPGMRKMVEVRLPTELERERLLAAQPKPETPPGYATVYILPPESGRADVWCGAVNIGGVLSKLLLRPGNYSCRVERFSPQESYLDFHVADGGTYYLLTDSESVNLAQATTAEALERWNWNRWNRFYISAGGKAVDLTEADPEAFQKLPPLVSDARDFPYFRAPEFLTQAARAQQRSSDAQESPAPGPAAGSATKTGGSDTRPTTLMVLEQTEDVTSKKAKTADEAHFQVVEDVTDAGLVVIAKGTEVKGRVERVDKRGGWGKDGGLIVRVGPVPTVTGEELPVASTLGQKGGKRDVKGGLAAAVGGIGTPAGPLALVILPLLPFIKGNHYVMRSGTRYKVEVTLPPQTDRARLLAAQPSRESTGYATVYAPPGAWCGGVYIGGYRKVLLRPGTYSCRLEIFSPQESYVDFVLSEGHSYYLAVDCGANCEKPDDIRLKLTTAAGVVDAWNSCIQDQRISWMQDHTPGKTMDLTKIDPEVFRRLPPFLRVER